MQLHKCKRRQQGSGVVGNWKRLANVTFYPPCNWLYDHILLSLSINFLIFTVLSHVHTYYALIALWIQRSVSYSIHRHVLVYKLFILNEFIQNKSKMIVEYRFFVHESKYSFYNHFHLLPSLSLKLKVIIKWLTIVFFFTMPTCLLLPIVFAQFSAFSLY